MKRQVVKTTFTALAVLLILLLGTANTSTLALPAADNLKLGEKMGYSLEIITNGYTKGFGNSYNNNTGDHLFNVTSIDKKDMRALELATLYISGIAELSNGIKMAKATGTGNRTASISYYDSNLVYDVVNQKYVDNKTYAGGNQEPLTSFSNEDRSFYYNDTQVPLSDFIFYLLAESMEDKEHSEETTTPNLAQDNNITVINNFFANFTPTLINSTFTGTGTYHINNNDYNLATLTRRYYNHTYVEFVGNEVNMFSFVNVSDADWYYNITLDFTLLSDIVYDSETGMLLVGTFGANITIGINAYTLVKNYDPDGDGPLSSFDLLVRLEGVSTFSITNKIEINYVSYLYQQETTNTTTSENTSSESTSTNQTSPLLNLPGFTFGAITIGLSFTIVALVVIRKRK